MKKNMTIFKNDSFFYLFTTKKRKEKVISVGICCVSM